MVRGPATVGPVSAISNLYKPEILFLHLKKIIGTRPSILCVTHQMSRKMRIFQVD